MSSSRPEVRLANAFYDKHEHQVTMCYELVRVIEQVLPKCPANRRRSSSRICRVVVFHSLSRAGHALIDVLDCRDWARRDAAVSYPCTC